MKEGATIAAQAGERIPSLAWLSGLLAPLSDAVLLVGADGRVRYGNPSAGRLLGRSPEALAGLAVGDLVQDGEALLGRRQEQPAYTDAVRPDGARTRVAVTSHPCPEGLTQLVLRTEAESPGDWERRLRESEARYRAVVEDQTDLIRRFTPDGRLTFVNPAFCRYYGRSEEELLGTDFLRLIHPEDREMVRRQLTALSPENPTTVTEARIPRPDGTVGWVHFVNRGIFDAGGRLVECQSVGRDVTAQKEAEARIAEAREAVNRAARMTTLAIIGGGVVHEINQPLNAIRVLAETGLCLLAQPGPLPAEEIVAVLSRISRQVDRIDSIVNHLRDVLKNRREQRYEYCDLNEVVDRALLLMDNRIQAHGIRLRLQKAHHLPRVLGYSVNLEEVVLNLLNNAVQALDEVDWPRKEISVRTWADDRVHLEVADNGPGFDPAVRDRVLEPFFTTKSGSSLGMGLPIVKAIVENADGRLELADAPGGGAVVRVSLPIATPP